MNALISIKETIYLRNRLFILNFQNALSYNAIQDKTLMIVPGSPTKPGMTVEPNKLAPLSIELVSVAIERHRLCNLCEDGFDVPLKEIQVKKQRS